MSSALSQSEEKANESIPPRTGQEGVLLLARIQTLASEMGGFVAFCILPSRHQVLRPFSPHLERFLSGFISEVLKGW